MAVTELIGLDEVHDLLRRIPAHSFVQTRKAMGKAVIKAHKKVSSFSGGLKSRTGFLRRSLQTDIQGTNLNNLTASVFTDSQYARIHELGGTITAKNAYKNVPGGPYLNIPLSSNQTAAGVTRKDARSVFSGGGYITKTKTGKYLVMSGTSVPMFILIKEVTIPAKLGMVKAAEDQIPTLLSELRNSLLVGI